MDVNSREMAFLGRESQFPGLDLDSLFRPSTYFYLRDRSWIAGGGAKGGRGDHRPEQAPFPADDGTPSPLWTINIAGSGATKTAGEGSGERDLEAHRPSAPGRRPGNHRLALPPVGRRLTIGRRRGRDVRVKRRAAAGSPAPWRTCQIRRRASTGCWVWETTGGRVTIWSTHYSPGGYEMVQSKHDDDGGGVDA